MPGVTAEPPADAERPIAADLAMNASEVKLLERELLGGERAMTRAEVSERAWVSEERARTLWRALGFADVAEDVPAFTERDVWALRTVARIGEEGWLDDEAQVSMTRAMGQSLARLADWQLATVGSMIEPHLSVDERLERARELVPVVEELLGYVWRRHLVSAAGRLLAEGHGELAPDCLVVGFADLVGFTTLTRQVDEDQLAQLVERFESRAADSVTECGGRVVKMIGDEVMFVADDPGTAAELGLHLSEQVTGDPELPDLRVGLALGTVLSRLGDVYGEPVNLAARLTSIARPGSVLVDRELADALESDARFVLRRAAPRPVRGYAMLQPFRLRRAEA
jgi:adenylate cyclase